MEIEIVKTKIFAYATDLDLNNKNFYHTMTGGRCRWKAENEVFNTMKNKGYGLGHNYGHGKKYLSTNVMLMIFLAFLFDQIFEIKNKLFNRTREIYKFKSYLWEAMRYAYKWCEFNNWEEFFLFLIKGHSPAPDTS